MRRTLAFALPLFAVLAATPGVARADDSILLKFGVGPMVAVGGNFLGKPGDKTYPGGPQNLYPGFSGTEFAYGAFVDVRVLALVGLEVDLLRVSGKGSGDITINSTAGSLQISQTATHIPVLVKGVLPLPLVAPFLLSDSSSQMSGELANFVTTNGAYSDNYKYWTFGFGMEIKLPLPELDIRIPISVRGSVNPGVSDKASDRWIWSANGNKPNIASSTMWQYQAQGAVGVGIYF